MSNLRIALVADIRRRQPGGGGLAHGCSDGRRQAGPELGPQDQVLQCRGHVSTLRQNGGMDIHDEIAQALEANDDDGEAARTHLAAGRWISYCDPDYPDDIIREWPDGRREFVDVDEKGQIVPILDRTPGPKRKTPRA